MLGLVEKKLTFRLLETSKAQKKLEVVCIKRILAPNLFYLYRPSLRWKIIVNRHNIGHPNVDASKAFILFSEYF